MSDPETEKEKAGERERRRILLHTRARIRATNSYKATAPVAAQGRNIASWIVARPVPIHWYTTTKNELRDLPRVRSRRHTDNDGSKEDHRRGLNWQVHRKWVSVSLST